MANPENDNAEIAPLSVSQDTPKTLHKEAIDELSNFSATKAAMTRDTATLVNVELDADPEQSEAPENKNKKKFEIAPTVDSNTPFITPDDYLRQQEEGQIITEGQAPFAQREKREAQPSLPEEDVSVDPLSALGTHVSSERDSEGRLKSVTSEALDAKVTFGFEKDGKLTRITQMEGKTDTTTFGADGQPVHTESSDPDSARQKQPRSTDDFVLVGRDSNGNPTSVVSNQNGINTVIEIDDNGNVKTRSVEFQDRAMVTDFDSKGEPTRNSLTLKDLNGMPIERTVLDKDGELTEKLDTNGKVVESERYSEKDKTNTTTTVLQNGSSLKIVDGGDSKIVELSDKDGNTRMVSVTTNNGQDVETEFYNEDGSMFSTIETPDALSSLLSRADGSWESTQREKKSGHTRKFAGDSEDDPGVEQHEV